MNLHDKQQWLQQFYTAAQLAQLTSAQLEQLYDHSQPQLVRIDSLADQHPNTYLLNSEDGYVPAHTWRNKGENPCVTLCSDSYTITASTDHFFEMNTGKWKYAAFIQPGEQIKTKTGVETVRSVEPAGTHTVYDFHINHTNHRYYTNSISSHNSGSGKSLFMANLGVNWCLAGLNVLYLTFELSENLVSMRLDSMVADVPTKDVFRNIDDVEMKVKLIGKKSGAFQVKYMPTGKNANDLRSYIKEFEIKTNKKVDAILVDYLDLMHPIAAKISAENLFVKDKYVSEELRNLAMELNVVFVTASQLNRCLTLDTEVEIQGKGRIAINDVEVGDRILSNTGYNTVLNKFPSTKQRVYQIRTKSGKTIRCSAEHIFPTADGEKKISSGLAVGDVLYQKR